MRRTMKVWGLPLVVAVLLGAGCGGQRSADALEEARLALYDDSLRHCAEAEYAAADSLLRQAEEARDAGRHREAERLADAARVQAERARQAAESRREQCERDRLARERGDLDEDRANLDADRDRPRDTAPRDPVVVDHDFVPIHFGFDQYTLSESALRILRGHVAYLRQNPGLRVVIEGHTDQHGSEEYNLALGERRARAVREHMVNQGVDASRISIVSYGKLVQVGTDDENRRCEFRVQ